MTEAARVGFERLVTGPVREEHAGKGVGRGSGIVTASDIRGALSVSLADGEPPS